MMKRFPEEAASGFEETITPRSDSQLPPSEGIFFNPHIRIEHADILNGPMLIQESIRADLYRAVQEKRVPIFKRNEILLKAAFINNHDTDHQDRDAFIAKRVFEAFPDKLDTSMLEPVLVGAMVHDMQYIEAARQYAISQLSRIRESWHSIGKMHSLRETKLLLPLVDAREKWMHFLSKLEHLESNTSDESVQDLWEDNSFPTQIAKKELDPHAELGMEMIEGWYEDEEFKQYFDAWTPEQKRVAALTIRDHSNGTDYDPFTTSQESKVLRLADKLDNTYERVPEWMLSERTLRDPNNCHRYVPTAIRTMDLEIDRANKSFTVFYSVDTKEVEHLMNRAAPDFTYSKEHFLDDFEKAYSKSMRIAAEVTFGLFAEGEELYSADATFRVCLRFPDEHEEIREYKPLPTAPNFA